ncbi:hypothetical protein ACJJH9_12140 [Microbulbifer sp. DLAB2-AF]|uniref:hypothetical protein n=1 Tax=Microbulbifer sp. DLAB2-AF TaxID=3243395 RepID=UPI00403A37F4
MKNLITFFLFLIVFSGCSSLSYDNPRIANSALIIENPGNYYGKYVRVIGYIHEQQGYYILFPAKEYAELPDRSRTLATITIQKDSESASKLATCSGKLAMLSGKISSFSGLPSIKEISYLEY